MILFCAFLAILAACGISANGANKSAGEEIRMILFCAFLAILAACGISANGANKQSRFTKPEYSD